MSVEKTGTNPYHYTVKLPNPVTHDTTSSLNDVMKGC